MLYPRSRFFRSYNGYSASLYDTVKTLSSVTVRKGFDYHYWVNDNTTVFEEAEVVPYDEVQRSFRNGLDPVRNIYESPQNNNQFAETYFNVLKGVLVDVWNPNKVHAFAVSSGYDSRVISMAIKELAEEYGSEWLGKVLFFEAAGEHDGFVKIMGIEGWNPDQYVVCYDGSKEERFRYNFDFSRMWYRLNGFISYPLNVWYTPIEWLQEQGIIPGDDKIQVFTVYGANETTKACKYPHLGLNWYFWWHYKHMLSAFPLKGQMIHPHYHPYMLRFMEANREFLAKVPDGFSAPMIVCQEMFPELRSVPKKKTVDMKMQGELDVPGKIMEQVETAYRKSWYGIQYPHARPYPRVEYNDWWGRVATASLCEYLVKSGKAVRFV